MVFAFAFLDREIVDRSDTAAHQTLRVELPILIAVAAEPLAGVVMPFIGEAHGDTVGVEGEHLLDQAIVELARPFAPQEGLDGFAPFEKLGAVSPTAIR